MVKHTKARRTRGRRMRGGDEGMADGAAVAPAADTTMAAPEQPGLLSRLGEKLSNLNPFKSSAPTGGRHTRRHRTGRKGRKGSKSRRV